MGVSYDSVETLKKFSQQSHVNFPLLADPKSAVIDAYGVRNKSVREGSRQDGIPHPITIVIDRQGRIAAKLPGTVVRRHTTADLIAVAKKLKD